MPTWAQITVSIVLGTLALFLSTYLKRKDEQKEHDEIVTTNPDAPSDIAEADAIQRLQDDRKLSAESKRSDGSND